MLVFPWGSFTNSVSLSHYRLVSNTSTPEFWTSYIDDAVQHFIFIPYMYIKVGEFSHELD